MDSTAVLEQSAQSPSNLPPEAPKLRKAAPNWEQIEADYVKGASIRTLATKYSVPFGTMNSRAVRGQWEQKRQMSDDIAHSVMQAEHSAERILPYSEVKPYASIAINAVDQVAESVKWKERAYKNALKIADGLERQEYANGHTKRLAEAASALASVNATARQTLGLDQEQADQPVRLMDIQAVVRSAPQVIDVARDERDATAESFDPGL